MKPFFRFAILALTLMVVALVSALTAMRFAIHGQEVQVPAIIGLSPSDAGRLVAGLGLQLEVERQYYSPQIAEGRIMSQLPLPGAKVRRGWEVRAAQSLGPQRVAIPDVTKESERAAEWNIRRRGLDLASTAEMQLPGTPADQVLAQSPPANAGQVAAPKTSLLVTVAADPPAYVMPSFLAQPLGTASRALQDAGFKLGTVSVAPPAAPSATAAGGPAGNN
ncbi:MAG: PASTA domain-containing protein, partial [Candidatus Sulfotelmatobacter sp.]